MVTTGTDVEQGVLPTGWQYVKLGELLLDMQVGFATGERVPDGVIQLRMNNVDTRGRLLWDTFIRVPATQAQIDRYSLANGDVIFNNTNSVELVGKSALFDGYDETVVFSNHFTRLRTIPYHLEPSYLTAWLTHMWNAGLFQKICNRWIGQSAIKNEKLLSLLIPLPPLSEQQRIAALLDAHMAAIAQARAAAASQLEAANALPAAYLRQVFDSAEAKTWSVRSIDDIAETTSGTTPSRAISAYYGGNIPWVKTGELRDTPISATEEYVTELALEACSLRMLPVGTLLIAMYGQGQTRGRTGLLEVETTTNQACFAILPNPQQFDSQYLQAWFRYSYSRLRDESESRGGNQPNLNGQLLRALSVPLPSITRQHEVAAQLKVRMDQIEHTTAMINNQLAAIDALPAALLRQAFAGEL